MGCLCRVRVAEGLRRGFRSVPRHSETLLGLIESMPRFISSVSCSENLAYKTTEFPSLQSRSLCCDETTVAEMKEGPWKDPRISKGVRLVGVAGLPPTESSHLDLKSYLNITSRDHHNHDLKSSLFILKLLFLTLFDYLESSRS